MRNLLVSVAMLTVIATGASATGESEIEALKTYCEADVERLCKGVPHEDGKLKACLVEHKEDISVGCAEALKKLKRS